MQAMAGRRHRPIRGGHADRRGNGIDYQAWLLTGRKLAERSPACAPRRHEIGDFQRELSGFLQLAISTVIFLHRGDGRESLGVGARYRKAVLTLALYSAGNLIMLRLVREFGMASAFSLSAVIQLVAVNVIALAWFGERLTGCRAPASCWRSSRSG